MSDSHIILTLTPQGIWGIVSSELKSITSPGRFMIVDRTLRKERLAAPGQEELKQLSILCEETQPKHLYLHYANKKMFRNEKSFWMSNDTMVKRHIKLMGDMRLVKAIQLADKLGIPILYIPESKTPLHMDDRLRLSPSTTVVPVMNFHRHDEGTEYHLHLRIGNHLVEDISQHHAVVLCHTPGVFILDNVIHFMAEGFGGQLLIPFINKPSVFIPRRMESDYFRKFILNNAAKVEINAEGFDIDDITEAPQPLFKVEYAIDGFYLLSLYFKYGSAEYPSDSTSPGRVSLRETEHSFRFTRQLRDKVAEQQYHDKLRLCGIQTNSHGNIRFSSLSSLIEWLKRNRTELCEQGFDIVQPSEQAYYIGPLDVEQSDQWQGDWLQTRVTIILDNGRLRIPFSHLRDTILRGEQEYMLPTGERLLIPQEWLSRYADLLLTGTTTKDNSIQRHRSQVSSGPPPPSIDPIACAPFHIPKHLKATLRPYQEKGVEWLWQNFIARTGCCLSDEMGLGKTIQTIALLLAYKEVAKPAPVRRPRPGFLFTDEEMRGETDNEGTSKQGIAEYHTSLVVAPASVVHNWLNEINRFSPTLQACSYTGDVAKRHEKRQTLMRQDVVLTTYRTLLNDIDYLSQQQFGIIIFDECQHFKTSTSQIHHAVKSLKAIHRQALSGTPVENGLEELWSLMNVLNPHLLGEARDFKKAFIQPIARQMEESRISLLRKMIAPYFLKRTKEEVLTDLPERQDEIVICPMTEEQTSLYASELSRARNEWMENNVPTNQRQIHMLAAIQRLRQIANGEGKMNEVFERLQNITGTHHKVLLFSEYVSMLERVGKEMNQKGWQYETLTGKTVNREEVINRFQNNPECQFFLISLKAGGVGLNLTAADYVFLLDPWWNKAAEEQAIARSHRIGQHHPVFVYRFIAEGTLEQQILNIQDRKQSLIDSVMPFICNETSNNAE
ncbi:MAG: DEAD/DEAH box helicase [Prevotella sp.]|nr:DEAD/DEAH box helicase [Prevotella sp.]